MTRGCSVRQGPSGQVGDGARRSRARQEDLSQAMTALVSWGINAATRCSMVRPIHWSPGSGGGRLDVESWGDQEPTPFRGRAKSPCSIAATLSAANGSASERSVQSHTSDLQHKFHPSWRRGTQFADDALDKSGSPLVLEKTRLLKGSSGTVQHMKCALRQLPGSHASVPDGASIALIVFGGLFVPRRVPEGRRLPALDNAERVTAKSPERAAGILR